VIVQKSSKRAFTLVELVIVIAILVTLTGFITANYVQYSEERKLADALVTLKTILTLARTKAATGDIGTYACSNFQGYEVVYDDTNKNYTTSICCGASPNAETCSTKYTVATYPIKTNLSIRSGPVSVVFLPFARGTAANSEVGIEFRNSFIKQCNYLKISPIGVIDQGTAYPC
jgi:prepilin-type N-terminal cleavage/methylation domain-containing protein